MTAQRQGIRLGKAGSGPEIDEAGPHSVGAQWLPAETIEGCSGRMAGASMQYIFKTDIETLWKVLEWMKRRGAGPHGGYVTVGLYGMVECEDIFDAIALLVIFQTCPSLKPTDVHCGCAVGAPLRVSPRRGDPRPRKSTFVLTAIIQAPRC